MESAKPKLSIDRISFKAWLLIALAILILPPLPFLFIVGRRSIFGLELARMLEWFGFGLSVFSFGLSYYHFKLSRNAAVPLIGLALLLAGIADAFPLTLLSSRPLAPFIDSHYYFLPWAGCHFLGGLILFLALAIIILSGTDSRGKSIKSVIAGGATLVALALLVCAVTYLLWHLYSWFHGPEELKISHDSLPLVAIKLAAVGAFLCFGLTLFRDFHRRAHTSFSAALLLSLVPRTGGFIESAFVADQLYDTGFYAASWSKFLAYLIPYVGLAVDYLRVSKELHAQVVASKQTEATLLGRQAFLNAQNRTIVKLARNPALTSGLIEEAFKQIVENSVDVLSVDCAGIWLLEKGSKQLGCRAMFERAERRHVPGPALSEPVSEELVGALEGERILAIEDSAADRQCPLFSRHYLQTKSAAAALAAPIRIGGRIVGIVMLEHAGAARNWEPSDSNFVGSLGDLAALAVDSAERIKTEEALSLSEERFKRYFELSPSGFSITTTDRRYLEVNTKLCEMLGYSREELLQQRWIDHTYFEDREAERELFDKMLGGELDSYTIDKRFVRKDGTIVIASVSAACIRKPDGETNHCIALIQDISGRKRTEDELRYRLEFEKLIAALSAEFINLSSAETDPGVNRALAAIGRFAQVDRSYIFLFSEDGSRMRNSHEWCREGMPSLMPQLQDLPVARLPWISSCIARMEAIMIPGGPELSTAARAELAVFRPGPPPSIIGVPLAVGGTAIGFLGFEVTSRPRTWSPDSVALLRIVAEMFVNVFERKRNEELVRVAQFALNQAADAVYWLNHSGHFIYVNETASRSLGYSRSELLSMTIHDVDPAVDQAVWERHWNRVKAQGSVTVESTQHTKSGDKVIVEVTSNWFRSGDEEFLYAVVRDIRERKEAAAVLEQQRAFFRQVIDINPNFIFTKDQDGRFTLANIAVAEVYGTTPEGLIGKSDLDFNPDPAQVEHFERFDRQVIITGREIIIPEEKITDAKGHTRWLQTVKRPLFDQNGVANQVLGVATDITLRKQAEEDRRKLERQIQHMQKLESLGVLAGGIAHDFNNLLMGMLGNAGLALMELPADSPTRKRLEKIKTASHRASELTNQLLAYSGKGRFFVRPVSISSIVEEMGSLLATIVSKKAAIHYEFKPDLPDIEGDPTQIRQVVMNLITNASDALGDKSGDIYVRTDVLAADRRFIEDTYLKETAEEGSYVMLEVRDTGIGMDQETVAKIFDPFFTTKFTGRGLGLAAVLGIVRGHRGTLKVESKPDEGTTFRILFPAASTGRAEISPTTSVASDAPAVLCSGAILVVDDEKTARTVTQEMLEQFGYTVITAADGQQAVDTFRNRHDEIAAVLLDMTMPNMDGVEAFKALRDINPEVRVVLTSGYTEQDATSRFSEAGLAGFIQKPYGPNDLLHKIREVLA